MRFEIVSSGFTSLDYYETQRGFSWHGETGEYEPRIDERTKNREETEEACTVLWLETEAI